MAEPGAPLLRTKLVVPPLRLPFVPRPRLTERLREALNYNLVLISASAGFGKTTLLTDWVRREAAKTPSAWLSLDEADNDPVRFWDYVVAALKTLEPAFGESTLAMLHSGQPLPVDSLLTVLINELAVISSRFVLVLDDYHLITSKPVHDGMAYLIEHMPSQMMVVIATRADPPLPLAHFRGKGMMLEMRNDDLRFRRDEAAALYKTMKAPRLSDEDAGKLESHTQGWAVGLKMAALALRRHPDVAGFVASFTGSQRYVMDYLMEEVLERQSDDVTRFLLETSVVERLSPPLCDALTGRGNSQNMLRELERANLFIAPLNESRDWYRYDHLFLDLLRHELEVTYGAGHVAELHRRASQWYEQHSFPDEAIDHALDARDWETAARLVREQWTEKSRVGEDVTTLNWLRRLPEEVRNRDWSLCAVYGHLLVGQGELDAAEAVAGHMAKTAVGDDTLRVNAAVTGQASVALLQARIAVARGDTRALELGKQALSLLPPEAYDARSALAVSLGTFLWTRGRVNEAVTWLTEAYDAARRAGHRFLAAYSAGMLASSGASLRSAVERFRSAIELAGPHPIAAVSHQGLGWTLYEWNDLDAAILQIERAAEVGQLRGEQPFVARQHALLAHCRLARGDETGALHAIEKAHLIAQGTGRPGPIADIAAYHILLALRQGDVMTASEWGLVLAGDIGAMPFYHKHVPPRLLIAQGETSAAYQELQVLYEAFTRENLPNLAIKTRVYQLLAADNTETALGFLADVMAMAEPDGYVRTFVDEGRLLAPLLRQCVSRGISSHYARKLLAIIEAEDGQKQGAKREAKGLLSEREFEVLQLLAAGQSSREIAGKLTVSLNTANTHIRHIFEKLDAKGRVQAIARARELKLIP